MTEETLDVSSGASADGWSVVATVEEGRSLLTICGELDALTAAELQRHVAAASEDEVQLDLAGVGFIDSSGLAVLIEEHLRLRAEHRRLSVTGRSAAVQRVLDLSGVSAQLDLDGRQRGEG